MRKNNDSKKALDTIIKKSRVHFYKPIQVAEILYNHRVKENLNLKDLESYRNVSKKWRDNVSIRLIGRRSTSSQKYQDNVFDNNAMPPNLLYELGKINNDNGGMVEAYVYNSLREKLSSVYEIEKYIKDATMDNFSLKHLISIFRQDSGLRRSIDKMYEITVYALFSTIVRELKAQITIEIKNEDKEVLKDFENFIRMVIGIDSKKTKLILPAALYRVGVTNAADRGLDMWANFGAAVQVKHLTLTPETIEDIVEEIKADRIVIVCLTTEKKVIEALLKQMGWAEKIQGIITLDDLNDWYNLCLSKKYKDRLGKNLLSDMERELKAEFPSSDEITPFLKERGYTKMALSDEWKI